MPGLGWRRGFLQQLRDNSLLGLPNRLPVFLGLSDLALVAIDVFSDILSLSRLASSWVFFTHAPLLAVSFFWGALVVCFLHRTFCFPLSFDPAGLVGFRVRRDKKVIPVTRS
jgi:hypothetical protein